MPNRTDPDDPGKAREAMVDLAHEPPFVMGGTRVRPSHCEVHAHGRRIRLQPRVMQVLVALYRANGDVVSRDELTALCWGGVVVGDDALNRCIQRLRKLSTETPVGDFSIKTLPRIGYRLVSGAADGAELPRDPPTYRRRGVLGVALALAAAAAGLWIWQARRANWTVTSAVHRIATPLNERYPAFSPDGKMLAYSAGPDIVSRHILIARVAGGEPVELTHDGFDDAAPTWAPDGARILYVAYRKGEPCRFMLVDAPAGEPREVGRCMMDERTQPVFTPRGDEILFLDRKNSTSPERITRLRLDDGGRSQVTGAAGDHDEGVPEISPDGRRLVFSRALNDENARLIVRDLAPGREHALLTVSGSDTYTWSRDSSTVFLGRSTGSDYEIVSIPRGGGNPVNVMTFPLEIGRLASGAGDQLAVELEHDATSPATYTPGTGTTPVILAPQSTGGSWDYAFNLKGDLAYGSNQSGEYSLWVIPSGGRARQLISFGQTAITRFAWSPDGSRIAMVSTSNGRNAVRIVSSAGEQLAVIPLDNANMGSISWSADGSSLIYTARDLRWRLWRLRLDGRSRSVLADGRDWMRAIVHGADIYALKPDLTSVWSLATSKPVAVAPKGFKPLRALLTPGAAIFGAFDTSGRLEFVAVPYGGGPMRKLGSPPGASMFTKIAINPLTGAVVYGATSGTNTDIEILRLARR